MNCVNCRQELQRDACYCPSCGQSTSSLNRPISIVLKETMHELLDIDGRLWLTLKTLLTKPGLLTKEFNQGKRVKYTPALRLYLAISILFFIFVSNIYHVYDPSRQISAPTSEFYSKAMFVLFPLFAALIQLFFRGSYYIGNLVFSMHIHCMVYLMLMIIVPLEAFETKSVIFLLLQIPPTLYLIWYIYSSFKTVFAQSWLLTISKASAIYFIYMAALGLVFDVLMTQFL